MKALVQFCKWFVGILFIFSGLIKLNDPLGFSYKLDEYFSAAVLGLEFLQPFALPMAVFLVVFEVVVGVMLLLGFQKRFTLWSLLLMIVFFTFLTFYSAYFNKVTDCGCFGDAIPLTPWESFWKDVVLSIMIVILFVKRDFLKPLVTIKYSRVLVFGSTLICFGIAYHVLMHLPIIDFRAYKVGVDINENMQDDPSQPDVYAYDWYYTIDGEQVIVTTDGLPPEGYGAYDQVLPRLIEEGYVPPIHDFSMEREGTDYTQSVLSYDKVAVVIMYNLSKSESEGLSELPDFISSAKAKGYQVVALSASGDTAVNEVKASYNFDIPFYVTDETALKTMVRSNPGVVLLEKGTIKAKSHWNDFEDLAL